MTIASALNDLNTDIINARTAITTKGGTVTVDGGSSQLASDIATIPTGGSGGGIQREVVNGVYQVPASSFTFSLPSNATDIAEYALYYAFYNCTGITCANLSSLINISARQSMYYAFRNCTNLTSVDFSGLVSITAHEALDGVFRNCTNLSSVDFSNLETIGDGSMSSSNNSHFYYTFYGDSSLTSLTFPKLEKIYCTSSAASGGTFNNNNTIQKMYFPKLHTITYGAGASTNNQTGCKNIFYNCSALTELHFGAANQSAIEASPGYSTAWGRGAGNVTIYFDL